MTARWSWADIGPGNFRIKEQYEAFREAVDAFNRSVAAGEPNVRALREEVSRLANLDPENSELTRFAAELLKSTGEADRLARALAGAEGAIDGTALAAERAAKAASVHGHLIAEITGLQAALDGKLAAALATTTVPYRVPSGRYTTNALTATNPTTAPGAANRIELVPWLCPFSQSFDQFGTNVTAAVAGALGKVVVYAADADGYPSTLLYESGDMDFSTTGAKTATPGAPLNFVRGALYWVGLRFSANATVSVHNAYTTPQLGSASIGSVGKALRRTLAYATGAPNPWGYVVGEESNPNPVCVWMRAA